jgi:hypothetical protein
MPSYPVPKANRDMFGNVYYTQEEPPASAPPIQQERQYEQKQPFIFVSSEKEALDSPIDKLNVGIVHIYSMTDGKTIYAKQINPGTFEMEFKTYTEVVPDTQMTLDINQTTLNSINERLEKIQQFIDSASSLFMSGAFNKPEAPPKKVKKEPAEGREES